MGTYSLVLCTGNEKNDRNVIEKLLQTKTSHAIKLVFFSCSYSDAGNQYIHKLSVDYDIHSYNVFLVPYIPELINNDIEIDFLKDPTHLYCVPNLLITILSLTVAYSEAKKITEIWVGLEKQGLTFISPNYQALLDAFCDLVSVGISQKHKVNLHFDIFNCYDFIDTNNYLVTDKEQAVILFSGGLDCVATAYIMHALNKKLHLFNLVYESSNRYQEKYSVEQFIAHTKNLGNFQYKSVSMSTLKEFGGSVCLDDEQMLSEQNWADEYVPFRNTIFIAIALLYACVNNIGFIVTGSHNDDTLCPDNRLEYYQMFQNLLMQQYSTRNISLCPIGLYLGGKRELLYVANKLGANFKYSWSCNNFTPVYEVGPNAKQCGICSNCVSRYSAFKSIELVDPIGYKEIPNVKTNWYGWTKDADKILKEINVDKF